MRIEVCGPGCPKCASAEQNVRTALQELNITAEVVKVTDIDLMLEKGVMWTPALLIDGKLAVQGKIPSVEQIKGFLQGAEGMS
jgi:small redox-active disulfide protein 2